MVGALFGRWNMSLGNQLIKDGAKLESRKALLALILLGTCVAVMDSDIYLSMDPRRHSFQDFLGLSVACFGLLMQIIAIGFPSAFLGNTFATSISEPRSVGLLSLFRTPLDFGEFLSWLALPIIAGSNALIVIYILAALLCYERIILHREHVLTQRFNNRYLNWAERTPLILPKLTRWSSSPEAFNWRLTGLSLKSRLTGLLLALCFIEVFKTFSNGKFDVLAVSGLWLILGAISVFSAAVFFPVYLVRIFMKNLKMFFNGPQR